MPHEDISPVNTKRGSLLLGSNNTYYVFLDKWEEIVVEEIDEGYKASWEEVYCIGPDKEAEISMVRDLMLIIDDNN